MPYAIAAAGTAGHVHPALAVAEELVRSGVPSHEVVFFGGDRFEAKAIPSAGFELVRLRLAGLSRSLTLDNLALPGIVIAARDRVEQELVARRVRCVLAMGSYVTIPVAWAARRCGVPYVVQEQNADAGLANRIAARGATEVFISFEHTKGLAGTHVGNPIRPGILDPTPSVAEAHHRYDIRPDSRVVGVVGGTLGAAALNEAVAELVRSWSGPRLDVVHLVGARFEGRWASAAEDHPGWHVVGFEDEMRFFYAAAELVVSRAGGMVAELLATGTPGVLVPGGFGSKGHQAANASQLAKLGAALSVPEAELGRLSATVATVLEDADRLASMRTAALQAGRPHAAQVIARRMREIHDRSA